MSGPVTDAGMVLPSPAARPPKEKPVLADGLACSVRCACGLCRRGISLNSAAGLGAAWLGCPLVAPAIRGDDLASGSVESGG